MSEQIYLGICVEGQTEAMFVKYVLARYLIKYNIILADPINLNGNINISRITKILSIMSSQYDYVTTLYDFYGFQNKLQNETHIELAQRILDNIDEEHRFNIIPYVQKYEFESLLYSDISILCKNLYSDLKDIQQCEIDFINDTKDKFPEDINDSIATAPSKRIQKIFKKYKKGVYGYIIAQDIGIDKIRQKCPNFSLWLDRLINLS